jgi:hypothetical protein
MTSASVKERFQYLTSAEAELILRLRLIVARAAQPDSLRWWNDRSLTAEGGYLAERLFARRPRLAAAKIALGAARRRHAAAVPNSSKTVHLFDLGDEAEYELSAVPLDEAWIPATPFTSGAMVLDAVAAIIPEGTGYTRQFSGLHGTLTGPLEVQLTPDSDPTMKLVVAQASALALAHGEAGPDRPVFPYLKR